MVVNSINDKLRTLRRSKNTTQSELAKVLQTSQQQVARWEKGASPISFNKLLEICKIFEVKINDVFPDAVDPIKDFLDLDTKPPKKSKIETKKIEENRKILEKKHGVKFLKDGELDESAFYELHFNFNTNKQFNNPDNDYQGVAVDISQNFDKTFHVTENTHYDVLNSLYNNENNRVSNNEEFLVFEHTEGNAYININNISELTYLFEPHLDSKFNKEKIVRNLKNQIKNRADDKEKLIKNIKSEKTKENEEIKNYEDLTDVDSYPFYTLSYMTKRKLYWTHVYISESNTFFNYENEVENQVDNINLQIEDTDLRFVTFMDQEGEWISLNKRDIFALNICEEVDM